MAIIVPSKLVEQNEGFGRTINQLMEIFINKEREMDKKSVKEFQVAIVEIFDDGKSPKVYLDEEATFILTFKNKKLDQNSVGRKMTVDLKEIEKIEWHNGALGKNSAKFFIVRWNKDYWVLGFDFRYNKDIAKINLDRAREFLNAAKKLDSDSDLNPLIYLLWSVCELIIDVRLYLLPCEKPLPMHRDRKEKVGKFSKTSNIFSDEFIKTFDKLLQEKNNARYGGIVNGKLDKNFCDKVKIILEKEIQDVKI